MNVLVRRNRLGQSKFENEVKVQYFDGFNKGDSECRVIIEKLNFQYEGYYREYEGSIDKQMVVHGGRESTLYLRQLWA